MNTWMVRAGAGGRLFSHFKDDSVIGLGWYELNDLDILKISDRKTLQSLVLERTDLRPQSAMMTASQLIRFIHEFKQSDRVVTYDTSARKYLCGTIVSEAIRNPNAGTEERIYTRKVRWEHETDRDDLSNTARNSLGAISTIFAIKPDHSAELWKERAYSQSEVEVELENTDEELDFIALAEERLKDTIARLDGHEMEQLVAGLLRAMGYKTTVSPTGPDRGKDIIASPDGLGFEDPVIVVEVKHRPRERMSAPQIRSFLGGRTSGEKGLYVSTGGFTRDALYEAERAEKPLTVMDFEKLVEMISDYYHNFDDDTRKLLPLKRLYWPG